MSIGGFISGLISPSPTGQVLRRFAAEARAVDSVRPVDPAPRVRDCGNCGVCPSCQSAASAGVSASPIVDRVELSEAAISASRKTEKPSASQDASAAARPYHELSDEQRERVDELKARDREVRQHEAAHIAAAGQYALGGASFEYETGPDGAQYAVGGEVQIDTSPVRGDPEATVAKMRIVKAAALAPNEPSDQDRKVAAQADQVMREAQAELSKENHAQAVDKVDSAAHAEDSAAAYDAAGRPIAGAAHSAASSNQQPDAARPAHAIARQAYQDFSNTGGSVARGLGAQRAALNLVA